MKEENKHKSNGTSTIRGYMVEARVYLMNHGRPVSLNDGVLTEKWREVSFIRDGNPAGVPAISPYFCYAGEYLTYESAMALAWTVVAQHQHQPIECRLVVYKIIQSYSSEKEGTIAMPIIREQWLSGKLEIIKPTEELVTPETPTTPKSFDPHNNP